MENSAIWDKQEIVILKGRRIELDNRLCKSDTRKKRVHSDCRDSMGGPDWQTVVAAAGPQGLQARPATEDLESSPDHFAVFVFETSKPSLSTNTAQALRHTSQPSEGEGGSRGAPAGNGVPEVTPMAASTSGRSSSKACGLSASGCLPHAQNITIVCDH